MLGINTFRQVSAKVAQQVAAANGQTIQKAQPSELILMAALSASEGEYILNFDHDTQQNVAPITRGIQFRNGFQAMAMAVGILPVKVASGVKYWGAQAPVFFPDPNIFSGAATAVLTEAQALEGIYMGDWTLQTNEGVRIDRQPLISYRTVEEMQASTRVTGFSGTTSTFTTKPMQIGNEFKSLGGVYTIYGGDDNYIKIKIQCQDKTDLPGVATRSNYLYVRLLGTEVKGGTTAKLQR